MEVALQSHSRFHHLPTGSPPQPIPELPVSRSKARRYDDDYLATTLSAFYGKFLVVLGVALPVTQSITAGVSETTYDVFYLYLYLGSMGFLLYMYITYLKRETGSQAETSKLAADDCIHLESGTSSRKHYDVRYGSFYLRIGVAGFGIGSMIYALLASGQYVELRSTPQCDDVLVAVTPLTRAAFVLAQMIFIFSNNNKVVEVSRHALAARFGLMHMIATNVCEWLYVLVEETKHDIVRSLHSPPSNATLDCMHTHIMAALLRNAAPFLFPCTVEYSLLCAVILSVMWLTSCRGDAPRYVSGGVSVVHRRSQSQYSVDCAAAHTGLFAGVLAVVLSIVSLIMFFELVRQHQLVETAVLQVNVWETLLFAAATAAAVVCTSQIRRVSLRGGPRHLELEHVLLLVTQSGVFLYFLFQIIGGYFSVYSEGNRWAVMRIVTPMAALLQSVCQTVLVLDAWKRRCATPAQVRRKPGRQLITFLLVANMAMWMVNRLKNNRAEFHPLQMDFYGVWAWTVITHVSMPLVVCYRFQSTVCLYEIWKHVYKMRRPI